MSGETTARAGSGPQPPYTHQVHAAVCRDAAQAGVVLLQQRVQVRMSGVGQCARILDAWTTSDGQDMWKLQVEGFGIGSFPVHRVRQCGGLDGKCICEVDSVGLPAGCAELAMRAPQAGRRP